MKEIGLNDLRQRWEDGTMSIDEWSRAIDEYLARDLLSILHLIGCDITIPGRKRSTGQSMIDRHHIAASLKGLVI